MALAISTLGACTADDATVSPPNHHDAGSDATLVDGGPADVITNDGTTKDSGDASIDQGAVEAGGPVTYTVPASGGSVSVQGAHTAITFAFPASAAGKTLTLTPALAASIGWSNDFSDVIAMTPDGTTFIDPVVVTPASKQLLVMSTATGSTKGVPEMLPLAPSGTGFLLTHFSSLAIVDPALSCDTTSGWESLANDPLCTKYGGAATTRLAFNCKAYKFCAIVAASCCVPPGTTRTDCEIGDNNLYLATQSTDSSGGQYPYCGTDAGARPTCPAATSTTIGDGGAAGGSCTATTGFRGDTYSLTCSPTADTDGGQACVCSKNGSLHDLASGENACATLSGSLSNCMLGGCNPQ